MISISLMAQTFDVPTLSAETQRTIVSMHHAIVECMSLPLWEMSDTSCTEFILLLFYFTWTSPTDFLHVKGCAATSNKFSVSNDIVKDCWQFLRVCIDFEPRLEVRTSLWSLWLKVVEYVLWPRYMFQDQRSMSLQDSTKFGPGVWSLYSLHLVLFEFTVYRQWTWTI